MESVLADLSNELGSEAVIGKVHEGERSLFKKFGVRGIPAIFILRDTEVRESFVGTRTKKVLLDALKKRGS